MAALKYETMACPNPLRWTGSAGAQELSFSLRVQPEDSPPSLNPVPSRQTPLTLRERSQVESKLTAHHGLIIKMSRAHFSCQEDQEDLQSMVRLAVCRKWRLFNADLGSFSTWLGSIVKSEASAMKRQIARQPKTASNPETLEDYLDSMPSPTEEEAPADSWQDRVTQLPEPYKKALVYTRFFGLSCREAGALMGTAENTVRTYVWRARRILKSLPSGETA